MLATPTRRVPTGPEWAHEVKWDGMRILADIHDGQVRLTSRTERDVTVAFPELAGLANEFEDMLLDGEAVVLRDGIPSFAALAERFHVTSPTKAAALAARAPVTLMVFDLLRLYGVDLTGRSWTDRRATLERLELQNPHWTVPPTFTDGQALWEATREQGLEGIVSKRRSGRYAAGARTEDWVKLPHRTSQSVVIGGWRPETDQVDRLGAVLVGVPGVGGLRYLGRVGSGIAGKTARALAADLAPLTSANDNVVERNEFYDNAVGVYFMYTEGGVVKNNIISHATGATGMGIGFKEASGTIIENNEIIYCGVGIGSDLSPFQPDSTIEIRGNRFAYNGVGILFNSETGGNNMIDNVFEGNLTQVAYGGHGDNNNSPKNVWSGNYWDDYQGFDRNADGVGDKTHELYAYADQIWMELPIARFFRSSPVMELLDFLERLAPFSTPDLILRDEKPRFVKPERTARS